MQKVHTQIKEAPDSSSFKKGWDFKMKYFFAVAVFAALVGSLIVGAANAGVGPRRSAAVSGGCACQQAYAYEAEASGGCCSQVMIQPAYTGGCASSSRVTLAERSIARRAARANFEKTQAAFLAAAAKGDLGTPVEGASLVTMKMVPVEPIKEKVKE